MKQLLIILLILTTFACADTVDDARDLLAQKQYKKAFKLLQAEASDENMKEPRFALAIADAARLHAPEISMANGGDRYRVESYVGAGRLYQKVLANKQADENQKLIADVGLTQLKLAMVEEIKEFQDQGYYEHVLRLAQAMTELWPEDKFGYLIIYELGVQFKKTDFQLEGLRGLVATGVKEMSYYSLAALLEEDEGEGAEAALNHLEKGLTVLPGDLALLDAKIRLLLSLNRSKDAYDNLLVFERGAAKIKDEKKRVLYVAAAGAVYDQLGKSDQAVERYKWTIERQPNNLTVRNLLGGIYFQRAAKLLAEDKSAETNFKLAQTQFEYVHKNGEPDVNVMSALAEIYERSGDSEASLKMRENIRKVRNGLPIR